MSLICRLCLSTPSHNDLRQVETIEEKQFRIVLPEVDMDIIDPSLICTKCAETLQAAYVFKATCLETERLLQSYVQTIGSDKLDLAELIKKNQPITIKYDDVKIEVDGENSIDGDADSVCSDKNVSKLQCPICLKHYKSTHLNFHISRHLGVEEEMNGAVEKHRDLYASSENKNLICMICKESSVNIENLLKHVKSHFVLKKRDDNDRANQFTCKFCSKTFSIKQHLIAHGKSHFQRPRCTFCNRSFTELSSLKRHYHMMHHTSLESNVSEAIEYEIDENSMKDALNEHLGKTDLNKETNEISSRPFRCHICPKNYFKKSHLKQHILTHISRPKCTLCQKIYTSLRTYKRHMVEVHKTNLDINSEYLRNIVMIPGFTKSPTTANKSYKCELCGKILKTKRNFLKHKLAHVKNRNVTCYLCGKEFVKRISLMKHIDTVHRGIKEKIERSPKPSYTCETCGIMTRGKAYLTEHMRIHSGEKPYKCDECGKAFTQNSTLTSHKKVVHSDEYPFTCEYCSKRFKLMGSLTKHLNAIHNPEKLEKKFECTQCGKKFHVNSRLKEHTKRHNKDKQHGCDICGKRFLDGASVRKHRVTHFSEKKHKCDICGKGFHQKYNIKIHMKVHGRIE